MANSYDALQAEPKFKVEIIKPTFNFAVASRWYSTFTTAGLPDPGSSTLSVQGTGEMVTRANAGFPNPITSNHNSGTGYLGIDEITFAASINPATGPVIRAKLFQALARYGTYAFNANTAVTDASVYDGELWLEVVGAITGTLNVTVTYSGGTLTTSLSLSAPAAGTFWKFPAPGINTITQVVATTATAGTFNLWQLRQAWNGAIGPGLPNSTRVRNGLNEFGLTEVTTEASAALLLLVRSTATGTVPLELELTTSRVEF